MLKIVKNKGSNNYVSGGVNFLLLDHWKTNTYQEIDNADAVLLISEKESNQKDCISRIRTHKDPEIALLPIFIKYPTNAINSIHTDGIFKEELSAKESKIIIKNIEQVATQLTGSYEERIRQRLLQYVYTRKSKLEAVKNRKSSIGYSFPILDLYFSDNPLSIFKELNHLKNKDWVTASLKDKLQLCSSCNDSFMIYKETCPKCKSIHIKDQDVVHHFPCAHVAPEEQFKNKDGDQLTCPKCDKNLRHIGIDYDKPSSVYHCHNCEHDFQNAEVIADCHSCGHKNQLEELIEVEISSYTITAKGIHTVEHGLLPEKKKVKTDIFGQLLKHEKIRTQDKEQKSYVLEVTIKASFLEMLNKTYADKFWEEIKYVANNYVLSNQYISQTDNKLLLLLIEQTTQESTETKERLEKNLNMLIEDNFGVSVQCILSLNTVQNYERSSP